MYAVFTANVSQFQKSMEKIMDSVEKTAKEVKNAANDIGEIGAVVAAGIGGAVLAASQTNYALQGQLHDIQQALFTMAVEIGKMFTPVLTELSGFLKKLVAWFQALSPAVKENVASFLLLVAQVGMVSLAVGKVADVVEKAAGILKGLTSLMGGGFLPVITMVTALVLLFGTLYKAWNDTSTGLKEGIESIVVKLKALWEQLKGFFEAVFRILLDSMAAQIRTMAGMFRALLDLPGIRDIPGMDKAIQFLRDMETVTGDKLMAGIGKAVNMAGDTATAVGKGVADGFKYSISGLKQAKDDVMKKLGWTDAKGSKAKMAMTPEEAKATNDMAGVVSAWHKAGTGAEYVSRSFQSLAKHAPKFDVIMYKLEQTAARTALVNSVKGAAGKIYAALGDAAGIITNAISAAATGGPMAALVSVVSDLLVKSETFQTIVTMVTNFIQFVADTIGTVLAPVLPVLATAFDIAATLLTAIQPALEMLLEP
ncbi:hypothetical protein ACN28S_29990 [Cystobacter fuscus]